MILQDDCLGLVLCRISDYKNILRLERVSKKWRSVLRSLPLCIVESNRFSFLSWDGMEGVLKALPRMTSELRLNTVLSDMFSLTDATQLKKLVLQDGFAIDVLPRLPGNLHSLELHRMKGLLHLDRNLPRALRSLVLTSNEQLRCISQKVQESLEILILRDCPSLQIMTAELKELRCLQTLELSNIGQMPASISSLTSLTSLKLQCPKRQSPGLSSMGYNTLTNLQNLALGDINSIPISEGMPVGLTSLALSGLRVAPPADLISCLVNLQDLKLSGEQFSNYQELDAICNLTSLTSMTLACEDVPRLPQPMTQLTALQQLSITSYNPDLDLYFSSKAGTAAADASNPAEQLLLLPSSLKSLEVDVLPSVFQAVPALIKGLTSLTELRSTCEAEMWL